MGDDRTMRVRGSTHTLSWARERNEKSVGRVSVSPNESSNRKKLQQHSYNMEHMNCFVRQYITA